MVRNPRIFIWTAALAGFGVPVLGVSAPVSQQPPRPPPQRSLEIPPIIDPEKTAVLSGFVPLRESAAAGAGAAGGAGAGPGAGAGAGPGAGEGAGAAGGAGPAGDTGAKGAVAKPEARRTVVWMVRPPGGRTPELPDQAIIVSESGFAPSTIAVTPGTAVDLRTFAPSVTSVRGEGLLRFERRLTRATRSIPVVPARAGAIDLSLRDAPETKGLIVCVDSPFLTVAEADGSFRIVALPPGRREIRVRLPGGKVLERTVQLVAGKELVVDWRESK